MRDVSENEIKQYFQTIDSNRAGSFNVIVTAIYQFYEYMQVKNLIKEVPFNYKYYLKKEILHHIILFALGIFVTLISYFISSRIMKKKEF